MQYLRYFLFATSILLVTACGRRLPDEYFDTNTDFEGDSVVIEATATDVLIEPTVEASSATNDATEDDSTDVEVTEPEVILVEAEADPIIEQVANADASNGEALFNSGVPCSTCHRVDSEDMLVGPGFLNLPMHAETRIEGVIAERYIYNSITAPNDFIVDGFAAAMPPNYPDSYSDEEIINIVAYLMTLGEYPERDPVFIEIPVETVDDTLETDSNEDDTPVIEETPESAPEDEASSDGEIVYVVVTATPSVTVEDTSDNEETQVTEAETQAVVIAPLPNFDLDLSTVPDTIDYLAEYGLVSRGEALFTENLVDDMSCESCHTDLSYVSLQDNASSYIWAAIYSADLHGDLASGYERTLSGADTAHLIAYLMSFNTVEE